MSERMAARDLADRLIAHARRSAEGVGDVQAVSLAIHRMSAELARMLGGAGCQAILMRVLDRARATHPSLEEVRIVLGSDPHLDLALGLETHPVEEVAEGLGTMLVELFELLDRLIGNDLSVQLAEMSKRDGRTSLANSGPEGSSPQSRGPA